jgi:DNA polymerase IV (archaeal DinB-like DNA polymerase)
MRRIIALVDLDYFYAQCEQLRKPELKGKPVVICMYSARGGDSGAVATANYEARDLGIHAGMPIVFAKKKATQETVFLATDRDHYTEVSDRVMAIIREFSPVVEQVSIDEAYFDLSFCNDFKKAEELARKIKSEIRKKEKLTCSIGIGPNKLIAKMASGFQKPDGLTVVPEKEVLSFIEPMKVSKLHGVGPKTEQILNQIAIETVGDLRYVASKSLKTIESKFSKNKALWLKNIANGIDDSPLEPNAEQLQYSKMGTLKNDTNKFDEIVYLLEEQASDVAQIVKKEKVKFKTVSIIPITTSIETHSKSKTLEEYTDSKEAILETAKDLLKEFLKDNPEIVLRRFGVRVSNLQRTAEAKQEKNLQKSLFEFKPL